MKLELKHIVVYLPYDIKVHTNYHEYSKGWFENRFTHSILSDWMNQRCCIRLVLRPLSDLTKEIEVNGEKFVPIEKFGYCSLEDCTNEDGSIDEFTSNYILTHMGYSFLEQLFEWRFDVFGLIENGLAIDINTLSQ